MQPCVKWSVVILMLAAGLVCATGAYADTLSWTITDIGGSTDLNPASGSGTITYNPSQPSGGGYLVTSFFTGTITIGGVGTSAISYSCVRIPGLFSSALLCWRNDFT